MSDFTLQPADNARLRNLCGPFDQHLRQIEDRLGVEIQNRSNQFTVTGEATRVDATERLVCRLYELTAAEALSPSKIHLHLSQAQIDASEEAHRDEVAIRTRRITVKARGPNQAQYLRAILDHDISFGVGPAGTGKTYLAVACAVEALDAER
ncbi:MAG: PhoH family protein, partial [Pseudomonadota bacterium]